MTKLDSAQTIAKDRVSSPWGSYPRSSIHRQRKLFGLPAGTVASAPTHWTESELSASACAAVRDDIGVAAVAAMHALAHYLCDDEESVIGVIAASPLAPQAIRLAASYVYVERDDAVASLSAQTAQCLERKVEAPASSAAALTNEAIAPVFFLTDANLPISAPVVLALRRAESGSVLRLGLAPEVSRFADPAQVLAAMEILLCALADPEPAATVAAVTERIAPVLSRPREQANESECTGAVAEMWAQLLDVPLHQIGQQTTYFELGGTSLNAFKLVAMVRTRFGVELNIRDIIEHDSLAAFAALIARKYREVAPAQEPGAVELRLAQSA